MDGQHKSTYYDVEQRHLCVKSYQPLVARQRAEATHGLFNDAHLFQVRDVGEDAFPVLVKPQLETGPRSECKKLTVGKEIEYLMRRIQYNNNNIQNLLHIV